MNTQAGWCDRCLERIGRRRFRALFQGKCEDCNKKYGIEIEEAKVEVIKEHEVDREYGIALVKKSYYKKCEITPEGEKRNAHYDRMRSEEKQLIEAFNLVGRVSKNWKKQAAQILGWNLKKVVHVANRLQKRKQGQLISPPPLEEQLIEVLQQEERPISAYEIAKKFSKIKGPWIGICLKRLAEKGKVEVLKQRPFPNLYKSIKVAK